MLLPRRLETLTVQNIESLTIPQLECAMYRWIEDRFSTGNQVFVNLRARYVNLTKKDF